VDRGRRDLEQRRSDEMTHFVGLDVPVKETSVCVVDAAGKVILEQKVPTEPADIIALLTSLGLAYGGIGIEAGPLSQWLVNALTAADLPVICVETRHMKALLTAQQINKTDRNDARGIAQMMRVGLFKPVQVKTLAAQEQRMREMVVAEGVRPAGGSTARDPSSHRRGRPAPGHGSAPDSGSTVASSAGARIAPPYLRLPEPAAKNTGKLQQGDNAFCFGRKMSSRGRRVG
jgi:hypothetical protein